MPSRGEASPREAQLVRTRAVIVSELLALASGFAGDLSRRLKMTGGGANDGTRSLEHAGISNNHRNHLQHDCARSGIAIDRGAFDGDLRRKTAGQQSPGGVLIECHCGHHIDRRSSLPVSRSSAPALPTIRRRHLPSR